VIDFTVIDGPFACPDEPVRDLERFLEGSQMRFRAWLKFYRELSPEEKVFSSPDVVTGLEDVTEYLIEKLRGVDGPFDGVLCFS
jgi:hypothetical protein